MSKRDDLLSERDSLINQKTLIDDRLKAIHDEILVIDRDIEDAKEKKKLASATHTAMRIKDDAKPGNGRKVLIKETPSGWTEVLSGDKYKKSDKPDMSNSVRRGDSYWGTWYRLVDIKEIEK